VIDTACRAAAALVELNERIRRVEVEIADDDANGPARIVAWRCDCDDVHVQLVQSRRWDRDAADRDLYDHRPQDL
jgi:hypothetical protein